MICYQCTILRLAVPCIHFFPHLFPFMIAFVGSACTTRWTTLVVTALVVIVSYTSGLSPFHFFVALVALLIHLL
jgi:hypothetical protein